MAEFKGQLLLDRYRVVKLLARGGMGSVYLAQDEHLERPVVVKVPHMRLLVDATFRGRFLAETEELKKLEHPHVVRILDKGEYKGVPYVVLQHLGGGSVADRARAARRGRLAAEEVLPWLRHVARALDNIHAQGIVHRDVKPSNILFDEHDHTYLSDFGVAKSASSRSSTLTGDGAMPGTPAYMAPEQALGEKLTGAADQYALAATLYHVLSGRVPFPGKTPVAMVIQKHKGLAEPLHDIAPEIPHAAAMTILRALKPDPDARFATCTEFVEAFEAGLGDPTPRPVPGWRRPKLVAALSVGALVVAGAVAFALLGRGGAESPGIEPPAASAAPALREATVEVTLPAADAVVPPGHVRVTGNVVGWVDGGVLVIAGRETPTVQGRFDTKVELRDEGPASVDVVFRYAPEGEKALRKAAASRRIVVDATKPKIELHEPKPVADGSLLLTGDVRDRHLAGFTVNGQELALGADDSFSYVVEFGGQLTHGLEVVATDQAGHTERIRRTYVRADVRLVIDGPAPETWLKAREVLVKGHVEGPAHPWRVQVGAIQVAAGQDGMFEQQVALPQDGPHSVGVQLFAEDGTSFGKGDVSVHVDTVVPAFKEVRAAATAEATVVSGRVVDENLARLECNGAPLRVASSGVFRATLPRETTALVLVATDRAGNRARHTTEPSKSTTDAKPDPPRAEPKPQPKEIDVAPRPLDNGVLVLDGTNGFRLELSEQPAVFTLECWLSDRDRWGDAYALTTPFCKLRGQSAVVTLAREGRPFAGTAYYSAQKTGDRVWRRWNHVAVSFDGTHVRYHLNGTPIFTQARRFEDLALYRGAGALGVGVDWSGAPTFSGLVDEVRLSRNIRYRAKFEPDRFLERDADTLALLRFDSLIDGRTPDSARAGRFAVPVGNPGIVRETKLAKGQDGVLQLDGRSGARLEMEEVKKHPATFTLEGWVKGPKGSAELLSLPMASIAWSDDGELIGHVYLEQEGKRTRHGLEHEVAPRRTRVLWDEWNHFALSYDGREMRLYLNGVLHGTARRRTRDTPVYGKAGLLTVGGPGFTGQIDEVRLSRGIRYHFKKFKPKHPLICDSRTTAFLPFDRLVDGRFPELVNEGSAAPFGTPALVADDR